MFFLLGSGWLLFISEKYICSVMLASSVLNHGFKPQSGQTIDYKIGIFCFSAEHLALRSESKEWLVRNQVNVVE